MVDKVILLDFWLNMFGMRVKIALAKKGIKYEYKQEDLLRNKSPLLLELNPIYSQKDPSSHPKWQTCVWNDKSPLLPFEPYQRAHAKFWADFVDKKLWTTKVEELEAGKKEFFETFKILEGELGDKPYFGGETFGFVYLSLVTFYCWFHAFEVFGNINIEAECPMIIAWAKRCLQKKTVAKSLANQKKVYEAVGQLRK
ncbi:hypothetical protein ACB098_11G044000 [Castanea mollissima]